MVNSAMRRSPAAAIPELSLADFMADGAARSRFEDDLLAALRASGFVIIRDHGVDLSILEAASADSAAFFAQSESDKMRVYGGRDGQRGYTPFGREHAKDNPAPDLKEFFHVGRSDPPADASPQDYPPNRWPAAPAGFRETFERLYDGLEEAGLRLLDALARPLRVAPDYFRAMATGGNSILRLLHYPPVPSGADPRSVRAAAHEDINLITLLVSANGAGLELLGRDGEWRALDAGPDKLIVDSGDMLARLTNDIIPATTHRVVNPSGPNVSRYSMPFFLHPRASAVLQCIPSCIGDGARHQPITAGEFLRQRLKAIGLAG